MRGISGIVIILGTKTWIANEERYRIRLERLCSVIKNELSEVLHDTLRHAPDYASILNNAIFVLFKVSYLAWSLYGAAMDKYFTAEQIMKTRRHTWLLDSERKSQDNPCIAKRIRKRAEEKKKSDGYGV